MKEKTLFQGQELTIKTYKTKPKYWVGKMKKYMSQTVTIVDVRVNGSIKILEDQNEVPGGWHWKLCNFVGF